jgi:hypothetical protein
MSTPAIELAGHVAARAFEEVRDRGFGCGQLFEVGFDAGTILGACLTGVLWTIAIDAGFEFAEPTGEDTSIDFTVVVLSAGNFAVGAATLAHESFAIRASEFPVVPVDIVST